MAQGNPDCVAAYEESPSIDQRLGDTAGESTSHYSLGHAYLQIATIRNLDTAESAYKRSLNGWAESDFLNRSKTINQIGMVHHERFTKSHQRGESAQTTLRHAQAAVKHYQQAQTLCPPNALADLGPMHHELGTLYAEVGRTESASEHFEKDVKICEQTGDRYGAGQTRFNIAVMYAGASEREPTPSRQRDLLHRAQAYAQAALRDFQHYQGRAADREADTQQLLAVIAEELAKLPG